MRRERITITLRGDILKRLDKMVDGNTIRNRSHAIESVLTEQLKSNILSCAIMLGGGEGIEFNGKKISKLLLPINDKTIVEHNIEVLKSYGITDLIFSLGAMGEQVREKLGDGSKYGIKVVYFERDRGTAGVLRQAKSLLENTFLMMNGDILLENIDLEDMYEFHKSSGGQATMLLAAVDESTNLGSITMKGNLITSFVEKPEKDENSSHLINGGVYLFNPEVCSVVSPEAPSLENNIFPGLAKEGKLFGYLLDGKWIHLHDMSKYKEFIKSKKETK
jgi:NDP-sugar pyrophosphorylase family protein